MFLNYLGAKVYGFSLAPNTKPSLFNILNLSEVVQYQEGNINDYDLL